MLVFALARFQIDAVGLADAVPVRRQVRRVEFNVLFQFYSSAHPSA
jgi:hypothetical protein